MKKNVSENRLADVMVVFDLDDTLHMRSAPFTETVREFFKETDAERVKRMFTEFRAIGVDYFHQWDAGSITEEEMYIRRTVDTFALYGYGLTDEEALRFHRTYEKYLKTIRPAEGIASALQTASDLGLSLGILTNGSPVRQRGKIRALGLEQWIPAGHISVSLELGVHKPDPEVFRLYQEKILSSAEGPAGPVEWWYVGDLYENDIGPALEAGWHTVWMVHDHEDKTTGYDIPPDYIVRSGKELEDVFRKIAGRQDKAGSDKK